MDAGKYRLRPDRERSCRLAQPAAGRRIAGYRPLEASARRGGGPDGGYQPGHHFLFYQAFPSFFAALMLQGVTGGFLGPAITAISLGLVGHAALPERLGRNQRFASTGNLVAAGLMGLIGYFLSYQVIFLTVAALTLPLFVALARIRAADIHFGRACGAPDHDMPGLPARASLRSLWKSPGLLTFAGCLFLFQLANASVLPLVVEDLVYQGEKRSSLIVSALIVLPQIVVAVMAPWIGQWAKNWGRRPLLLI